MAASAILKIRKIAISCLFYVLGHNGAWRWQYRREHRAAASSRKFATYSSGGATMFDFVVA